jgi:hypothetical protein
MITAHEDLLADTERCLERIYRFLELQPVDRTSPQKHRWKLSHGAEVDLPNSVRDRLALEFADDVARLRGITGQDFAHWSI